MAESEKIREVYSTEILLNTATIRKVNLTEIDSRHYSAKLLTTKQTSKLQNTQLNLLTVTFLAI